MEDWVSLAGTIRLLATEDFTAKNGAENIKLQVKNPEDYRNITSFLENEKVEFHTYQLEKSTILKAVIKNIPASTKTEAVKTELTEKGFNILAVSQMKDKLQTNLPLFLITLQKDDKAKDIFSLATLCYCRVKVESYKRKGDLTQCHRCQRYGHTSLNCKAKPKCVKCARDHFTWECTKKENTPGGLSSLCEGVHSLRGQPKCYKSGIES